jgi:two-component system, OmpR family, sensor histidine kinase QseC
MKNFLRPTLARRVVLALLLSYPLVCAALIGVLYLEYEHRQVYRNANFAEWPVALELRDALATVEEPAAACAVGAAMERVENGARARGNVPQTVVIQIRDRRDQGVIYSSPRAAASFLLGDPHRPINQLVHGQTFQVFEFDTPRWSVLWGRTLVNVPYLMGLVSDEVVYYMTIAFPFILLPAWLAVSHGLRPLRRLSQAIAARGAGELAPVDIETRHAELKPLVTALDDMLMRLRYKVESEQLFVANAAHELRTPLAVITAQAHTLVKAATVTEQVEAESRLNSAIERASHLIHQLLAIARLQIERSTELVAMDLALLTQRELANFVPAALERNIDISLQAPDKLLFVLEAHTFRSILQNLIDNAIRYGREGGNVAVELELRGGTLVLCVADDGPGISETERERVFERFYRGAGRSDARGSGLGLTIVKQAASRLNGRVQISSGLGGRGCSFVVEIHERGSQS